MYSYSYNSQNICDLIENTVLKNKDLILLIKPYCSFSTNLVKFLAL